MIYVIGVLWVLGALATVKLDAVWTESPVYLGNLALGLVTWPLILFFMLITKHSTYLDR